MLTSYLATALDQRIRASDHCPDFRAVIYSRLSDTDSDIVRGTAMQTPLDITSRVRSASLNLDMQSDSSSLSIALVLNGLHPALFYNCIIKIYEGDTKVPEDQWVCTFTGWSVQTPTASEEIIPGAAGVIPGKTERGNERTTQVTFTSRDQQYVDWEITTEGVWLPNSANNPDSVYAFRDGYDDVGSIAREIATDTAWGMGLEGDEVLIGVEPYRIEKQLQVVQTSPLEAIGMLGQVLHLSPWFNGEGKLKFISRRIDSPVSREVSGIEVVSISQNSGAYDTINAVTVLGLDKNLSEIPKPKQKLSTYQGTFGFFDSRMDFRETWGGDGNESYRVKVGTVVDGNGVTVQSPTFENFTVDGFIQGLISDPFFEAVSETKYHASIENDVFLSVALLLGFFSAYGGAVYTAALYKTYLETGTPGGQATANPGNASKDLASSAILISALWVLQQIGNFSFEIHGVPYETVYKELRADAVISNFNSLVPGTGPFREWERRTEEIKNTILSSLEDSIVPAITPTHPEITNPGCRTFARNELVIRLAEQAERTIKLRRDILLEPGDIIQDSDTGFKYKVKSISRELFRENEASMTLTVYRVPA